ncbi:uncharacterized protein LOC130613555 [Hydractinia symbiolongicarpus]|uniref:uncharacterized protein LOC130613555 n=1 Tax=Hydractinia symbiolongicarpus TaxID=13093 RepID=UPI0025511514|nr:uncharacterized protein LOC130613555 [Hydractinia symbiolongicarpus]
MGTLTIHHTLLWQRIRRTTRKKQDSLFAIMTLLDHDVFKPTADVNVLYTVPIKRRKKRIVKTPAKEVSGNWSNYDEIGALIEGVYEAKENSFVDQDERNLVNTDGYSKVDFRLSPPDFFQDDPYEIIGCKINSCCPGKKSHNKSPENGVENVKTTPRKNVNTPPEGQNPCSQAIENTHNVSMCKLNSSIRIKQQRTSLQRGNIQDQENVIFTNATHEYVTITPPLLKRSSPVLSENRNLKNKNSNEIKDKRKSCEKIAGVNDDSNRNAETDLEQEHHYFQVEPEYKNHEYEELASLASAEKFEIWRKH